MDDKCHICIMARMKKHPDAPLLWMEGWMNKWMVASRIAVTRMNFLWVFVCSLYPAF
jgi:hypothetical protein